VSGEGKDIIELLESLEASFPGIREQLCQKDGQIKRHISVFVNGQDMRSLQGEKTPLHDGDEVAFIPAVAGGDSSGRSIKLIRVGQGEHSDDSKKAKIEKG